MSRATIVAATAFVLTGALRLATAAEQLGLDTGFAVLFFAAAVVQIGFGVLLSVGSRRANSTPVLVAAMVITLGFVGLWLVATVATVPVYPLMNGPYPVDVLDLGTALLELTSIAAICRSMPQRTRRRVVWGLIGLVSAAWLVWAVVVAVAGLSD
jgi:hypothetical protein